MGMKVSREARSALAAPGVAVPPPCPAQTHPGGLQGTAPIKTLEMRGGGMGEDSKARAVLTRCSAPCPAVTSTAKAKQAGWQLHPTALQGIQESLENSWSNGVIQGAVCHSRV